MAKRELHAKAIELRKQGMSFTQIKEVVGVSNSTLSVWLRDYPLSKERIRELRIVTDQQIERTRESKSKTRNIRLLAVRSKAEKEIGTLTERDLLIAGFFLYWGEGSKTSHGTTSVSNTDPAVLRVFMSWLTLLKVPKERLRVNLHLYNDMDINSEISFWSNELGLPISTFRKPYIKKSLRENITFFQRFTHGTCNVIFENRDIFEYVQQGLGYLRDTFAVIPTT